MAEQAPRPDRPSAGHPHTGPIGSLPLDSPFWGLLELVPDAVLVVDADGCIRLLNAQAERRELKAEQRARRRAEGLVTRLQNIQAVTVTDDGVGFDTDATEQTAGHLGLTTIRERATSLGGWVRISSRAGEGTTVEICLPEGDEFDGSEGGR